MKNAAKVMASVLVLSMVFQTVTFGAKLDESDNSSSRKNEKSAYSLMYDSNEKLAEKIDSMPEFIAEEQVMEEVESGSKEMPGDSASENGVKDKDNNGNNETKEKILGLVEAGQVDKVPDLDISDEIKDEVSVMNEAVKEDRFIVKYRSETKGDLSGLMSKKSDGACVADSKRSGKTEVLILDEKVNPKEFADTLKDAGADEYIEYIQPDFKMEYAVAESCIGLVLAGTEQDGTDGTETSETPEASDPTGVQQPDEGEETEVPETPETPEPSGEEETADAGDTEASEQEIPEVTEVQPVVTQEPSQLSEVIVAVIDTGIDVTHPGLTDYIWTNAGETAGDEIDNDGNGYIDDMTGWNFYDDSAEVYDSSSPLQSAHGTHIAGIIAAADEDYNVKIIPLKVFGESGAYTSDIIDAIAFAESNGASIVNCSFGSTENNPALSEAIENSGMLFVCSVGNARSNLAETPIYPACFDLDNVISVASVNADGGLSYYSNYSSDLVDVAALGREVYSTLPEGEYGNQSGTSMSAAQVSGVAAAVLSVQNDLDTSGLRERLISTSDMLSNLQDTVNDGMRISLVNAVNDLEQTEIIDNYPEDDFSVVGYNPTQDELYQLYSDSGDVVQAAAGYSHTLVLKEDGTVWAWGYNYYGQCGNGITSYSESLTQVIGLTNVEYVAAGSFHSLAVKSDGTVWAWGYNNYSQLGDGTTAIRTTPVQVSGLTDVVGVSAGYYHSVAVKTDGTVWAWGENSFGQLGDGTTTNRTTPVQVNGLADVENVSAGYYYSVAVKTDGTVLAWGSNAYGRLGDGTTTNRTTPVQVSGLTSVVSVATGYSHSLVVKSDGTVWAWGYNNYGQLGDGTTAIRTTPVQVSGLTSMISVAAGYYHSIAVKSDGTVWAWGYNNYGQLGDGTTTTRTTPVQVNGLAGVVSVAAGYYHSLAMKTDGTVWAWGDNNYGQLGDGTTATRATPVQVSGLTGVVSVAAGFYHSVAVKSDGTVWTWGQNNYGQLGDGTTTTRTTPVQVSGLTGMFSVAAGHYHSVAVKSDGTVWAWGYNNYGQLGDGKTTTRTTPVQVSGLTDVVSVAAGSFHSVAVKSDGTVWAWGYN
ncbi:MAG: S8 family serine peptidase, partial [Oscillospiraceae bacterium]